MDISETRTSLFGGEKSWNPQDWTASDDRVRGGKSQSFLDCDSSDGVARFYGNLDIKTLGGAGFASQRTTGEDRSWDLSRFDGIELEITKSDAQADKQFTLILKDELLPRNPEDGREQSTISYEYDFKPEEIRKSVSSVKLFIPWDHLKATYRGREKKDAPTLNKSDIKRVSLMMRSFFGEQEGPFSLSIRSISAVTNPDSTIHAAPAQQNHGDEPLRNVQGEHDEKLGKRNDGVSYESGIARSILRMCGIL
ncbi:MAG: hypothetical protein M1837_004950 [Sclerophora amabilis]|nr:MAG: hypothetical protein M1837_004950 [Sclerophora amabilis]